LQRSPRSPSWKGGGRRRGRGERERRKGGEERGKDRGGIGSPNFQNVVAPLSLVTDESTIPQS